MRCNTGRQWIPARSWFLFNTWFSLLTICLSAAATLQVPINRAAWPILLFCCGLAIILVIRSNRAGPSKAFHWRGISSSVLFLGATIVVLWGSLVKGEFLSTYPDPWNYSVIAAYFRDPTLAISAAQQPILSIGSLFMGTRYGTPSLLALLAEITQTDTCRSADGFGILVLLQTGLGFSLLARSLRAGPVTALGAGLFGVAIGWVPEILKVGNWDQVLFLSFIPFVLLRLRLLTFQTSRKSGILALGVCLGAAIYSYPEGAAISGVIYLPMVVWKLMRGNDLLGKMKRLAMAASFALLLSSVYLPTFVSYLHYQISVKTQVAKGSFSGLLSRRWLPAFYCLGQQLPTAALHKLTRVGLIIPLVFVGLTFLALGGWWRRRDSILVTIPTFLLLILWQAVWAGYDYGTYKVLTMFWPIIVSAIFVGMAKLLSRCRGFARPAATVTFCALMAGAVFVEVGAFQYASWRQERRIEPFIELTGLKKKSGNAPICIRTQSWFNQYWALFFLQGYKVEIPNPLLFLKKFYSALEIPATEKSSEAVVLTDQSKPQALWHNKIFWLLSAIEPLEIVAIDAPNEVETVQDDTFIWLDNRFAVLTVHSDADRRAVLVISECWPGPSRPGDNNRTLIVEVNGAQTEIPTSKNLNISLALKKGDSLVRLACKESRTVDKLTSGDSRTLLLGLKRLTVKTED